MMLILRRRLSLVSWPQTSHLYAHFLHTQTVNWKKNDDEVERCQLLSFRSPDNNKNPLHALTVNDTTPAAIALAHLRKGQAVVYTGGDYHNARQLVSAVKRRIVGASGRQKRKMRAKTKKSISDEPGFDIREQWVKQKHMQREYAALVRRLLIQVSLDDNNRPSQIIGLKRIPANAKDILSFAFQNDEDLKLDCDEQSSPELSYFLLSLNDFVAMVGSYEWNRTGIFIDALQNYIHPHFGVFPPTRQDYIQLLEHINIDRKTQQNPIRMMEIGIGSGVLSLILLHQKKVDFVIGTDINPYAIACAKDNMHRSGFGNQIHLIQADLFPPYEAIMKDDTNIILFNPPWIPGDSGSPLDQAVFDSQNIWRRFLSQVQHYVNEDGHIYLLLSNIAMLLGLFREEDLHQMFEEGNLELVEVHKTKSKQEVARGKMVRDPPLEGIENVRAKEVISLYHLRVKR